MSSAGAGAGAAAAGAGAAGGGEWRQGLLAQKLQGVQAAAQPAGGTDVPPGFAVHQGLAQGSNPANSAARIGSSTGTLNPGMPSAQDLRSGAAANPAAALAAGMLGPNAAAAAASGLQLPAAAGLDPSSQDQLMAWLAGELSNKQQEALAGATGGGSSDLAMLSQLLGALNQVPGKAPAASQAQTHFGSPSLMQPLQGLQGLQAAHAGNLALALAGAQQASQASAPLQGMGNNPAGLLQGLQPPRNNVQGSMNSAALAGLGAASMPIDLMNASHLLQAAGRQQAAPAGGGNTAMPSNSPLSSSDAALNIQTWLEQQQQQLLQQPAPMQPPAGAQTMLSGSAGAAAAKPAEHKYGSPAATSPLTTAPLKRMRPTASQVSGMRQACRNLL